MKERVLAWHFLPEDKRLRRGTREEVRVGRVVRVDCEPVLCKKGLHASERAIDALEYAPGPILCRVEVRGTILRDSDKLVGTERKCLAMADATTLLHEFACWCAKLALKVAKVDDERCYTKLKWLKRQATDDELAAAWDAAWAAARAAQNKHLTSQFKRLLRCD